MCRFMYSQVDLRDDTDNSKAQVLTKIMDENSIIYSKNRANSRS